MDDFLSNEISRLEKTFGVIEQDRPFLKPITDAFREIMISRAILKAGLSDRTDIPIPLPESSRLSEGFPWLTEETIASFIDPWGKSVESAMLPLEKAFPGIAAEVLRLREAFGAGHVDLNRCIAVFVEGQEEDVIEIASVLNLQPLVLKFILGQALKPFVEKRTEILRPLIENLPWCQGYCPICGAFPEVSYLKGQEGQRWLRCSLCGYDWRFDRTVCPYCGEKNKSRELVCVDGVEHSWVELCSDCHRYIVGVDLREQPGLAVDVAAVGMAHLDIVAQQRGYLPAAECAWNMCL